MHEAAVEANIIGEIAFDAELTDGFSSGVDAIDPEDAIGSHELAVLTGRKDTTYLLSSLVRIVWQTSRRSLRSHPAPPGR
jgi:hypothetical protein